jgi:hypothetical protein
MMLAMSVEAAAETAAVAPLTVTAERLTRGALRAQASQFVRTVMADTRSGQNARWYDTLCPTTIGVRDDVGQLFTRRIAKVAAHVGLKMNTDPHCDPNIAVVFTTDPRALTRMIDKRQNGALSSNLPARDRSLLFKSELPVRWWHSTLPESADGKQFGPGAAGLGASAGLPSEVTYNNNARASRVDLPSRLRIAGAVVVIDIGRMGQVPVSALTDYVAMAALVRLQMRPAERPQGTIMAMFDPGAPRFEGFTDQDERFIEAMYDSKANVEGWRQRADMAGRMADMALSPEKPRR